jgi:hypothetical protein
MDNYDKYNVDDFSVNFFTKKKGTRRNTKEVRIYNTKYVRLQQEKASKPKKEKKLKRGGNK